MKKIAASPSSAYMRGQYDVVKYLLSLKKRGEVNRALKLIALGMKAAVKRHE